MKDANTVANSFNNLFLTITNKFKMHHLNKIDEITFLKNSFPNKFYEIKMIPTMEVEIKNITETDEASTSCKIATEFVTVCNIVVKHDLVKKL
jgi:hypothetical protein